MDLRATFLPAALALGACAGGKEAVTPDKDPYFNLPFVAAAPKDAAPAADAAQAEAYSIEFSVERATGSRLAAPRLILFRGQTGSIVVGSSAGTDATGVQPADDGLRAETCVSPAADGGATIGFHVVLSRSRDGGEVERADVSGTRWIEPGVVGMLARVTSPDGSGPLLVLARVTPLGREALPPDAAFSTWSMAGSVDAAPFARPMSGRTLHLRVSAAQIGRDFDPGSVVDETACPDVLKATGGRVLHDFEILSCLDSRVRLAGLVESGGHVRGLVADGRDDGTLQVSWTTTGEAHTASLRPSHGRRFLALARVDGGGTAGVIVSLDADD
jgi:hypothetical protein